MSSKAWSAWAVLFGMFAVVLATLPRLCLAQPAPPLKIDVPGAVAAVEDAPDQADAVRLPGFVVRHQRSIANTLPCIGCGGTQKVPMHLILDLADSVNSLFVVPSGKKPDDTADASLQWAHYYMCLPDNPLGCMVRVQDP